MDVTSLSSLDAGTGLEADICIVGSGPAGATLARELAGSRLQVIVVESGGLAPSADADALNEVENVGESRQEAQAELRSRMLGGTSALWSGRCIDFDEIDFAVRPWVPHSGWPISRDVLTPYFERSAAHLGLGAGIGFSGEGFWQLSGRKPASPGVDPDLVRPIFWQFSRTTNLAEYMRYAPVLRDEPADNVRILTDATVTHIDTDGAARAARGVEVAAPDGKRHSLRARAVVLCAGGIENARLLLSSNRVAANGLGNAHDMVGRFLMDHPRGGVGKFAPQDADRLAPHFGMHFVTTQRGTHLFCQGLRLSPEAQARHGLLNCAVWLSELVAADDPWSAVKRIARGQADWGRDAWSLARNAGLVASGLRRRLTTGAGLPRKLDGLELQAIVEQRPDPDSRVTLSHRLDRFGVPLSRIDWRRHPQERETIWRTTQMVIEALRGVGMPAPEPEGWLAEGAPFPENFRDVAHHIGTTRMSNDAATGVVDTECKLHGVEGVYVAGSSVFPTSSHANPTQMIVALSIQLADRLKTRLVNSQAP